MTGPAVYTIDPGIAFADALAAGVLERVGSEPLALPGVRILLPTRRACRAMQEAFLRLGGGRPQLLPRLSPLGDLDAEELGLALEELPDLAGGLAQAPAVPGLRRQLLLARAILAVPGLAASVAQAARLAADLARLLDQVQAERLGFDRLAQVVPAEHAAHWQQTLTFLRVLTDVWPGLLVAEGAIDPAERRNRLLEAQAAAWRQRPPSGLVIAAGSTGSLPATAALMAVVAGLPRGAVVLPGLDRSLDDDAWAALDESHPQYGLRQLLGRLGIERPAVRDWTADQRPPALRTVLEARRRLIGEALRPAATTDHWRALGVWEPRAVEGITRIDCPGAREEAGVIALLMREALEVPGKTAALVTPDRTLARRVAAALGRWGISIDDSGGTPLAETAIGSFLRLIAVVAAERCPPVPLLALLKHPLTAGGLAPPRFRSLARSLERAVLRGPRPGEGIPGLLAALARAETERFDRPNQRQVLAGWLDGLGDLLAPFESLISGEAAPADLVRAQVRVAEALAATDVAAGAERLWSHDDGESMAGFIAELLAAAGDFPPIPGHHYPALFESLLSGRVVRPRFGRHPRLMILGPLEARLVQADRVILAGLNEGTWPLEPPADPWLSRPMRRDFGLPAPERQIGLSAHDFAQLAGAPELVMTRSLRVEGAPTVPSRWLSRLDAVLRAAGLDGRIDQTAPQWLAWLGALDRPDRIRPCPPPEPRPPVAVRPRRLSVTEVETWMRDPYAIFARHVLGLVRLEPIAADPGALERGQFIHQALDAFVKAWPDNLPPEPVPALLECGRAAFGELLARPEVWAFWWPRFERIARWFIQFERQRRPRLRPLATEVRGRIQLEGRERAFELVAKADRLDRLDDGQVMIIDYKTGTLPVQGEIGLGFAPQLPLEAAIAESGGFDGIARAPVALLAHWRLSGGDPAGEERLVAGVPTILAEQAHGGLERLIWAFDDPATPYCARPRPDRAPRYSDYTHLARVLEWAAGGGDG